VLRTTCSIPLPVPLPEPLPEPVVRILFTAIEAAGGHRDTFAGLAGMGDLIVTRTSQRSRNRYVGEQLGAGKPIDEIIASMRSLRASRPPASSWSSP
jgi:hypothetical protein